MKKSIELRSHHVPVISDMMHLQFTQEEAELYPDSKDLLCFLESAKETRARYRQAYGDKVWDFIEDIARSTRQNKDLSFRIVDNQDVICKRCPFQEPCSRADYSGIYDAFRMARVPFEVKSETVEDRDRLCAKEFGLNLGEVRSAKSLFKGYLFK